MMRARFFLAVVLLSLGSTASLRAYVTSAAPIISEQIAILDNSAESVYPAENPWLNPESRNGLLCNNDPINGSDPLGLGDPSITGYFYAPVNPVPYENYITAPPSTSSFSFTSSGGPGSSGYGLQSLFALRSPGDGRGGGGGGATTVANQNFTIAQVSATTQPPSRKEYGTWQEAGKAGAEEAHRRVKGDDYKREYVVEIGQRGDKSARYIFTPPHAGPGPGSVPDKKGFFQRGEVDPSRIPTGYKMVGFGFAQVMYAPRINPDDRARADRRNWVVVLAVPPPQGGGGPIIYYHPSGR